MASDMKSLFFCFPLLFDTTSRSLGAGLNCGLAAASWESHPRQDRCRPPPLLASVAGRKYHDTLTGSLQNSAPCAVFRADGYRSHLIWPSLMGIAHRWSWRIPRGRFPAHHGSVSERIKVNGYADFKVPRGEEKRAPHCVGSEKPFSTTLFQNFFNSEIFF